MKNHSFYVDPKVLQEQNATDTPEGQVNPRQTVPDTSDGYPQLQPKTHTPTGKKPPVLGETPPSQAATQQQTPHDSEEIPMTKEDIKELAKEAYEEGVKAAKGEAKKEPQQPAQEEGHEKAAEENEEKQVAAPKKPQNSGAKDPKEEHKAAPNQTPKGEGKEQHKPSPSQEKKENEEPQEMLETIVQRNNHVLFKAKSVFPIDFFPDTILIDMTKISIIEKTFFATEHVTAIPLQSIADIYLQTTFLTAAITIKYILRTDRPGIIEPIEAKILGLRRDDAITAKNIIRGLVLANEENIDLTKIRIEDLRGKLEELGASKTGV